MTTTADRPDALDLRGLFRLMDRQAGVVSRRQFTSLGGRHNDLERLLRREQLARMLPGVLIAPTDRPSWQQRAWAGVLQYWPAALAGESALRAMAGPGWRRYDDAGPITLAVGRAQRSLQPLEGYDAHKRRRLDELADWDAAPPRLRPEEVALDLASRTDEGPWAGIEALSMVIDLRGVTPETLRAAADRRARLRNAGWLRPLVRDLDRGRPLLLERGHRERVEAPHGLPRGRRWRPRAGTPADGGRVVLVYAPHRTSAELDGRLRHDSAGRHDRELEARLDQAVAAGHDRRMRVALAWGQVFDRECATAARLAALLRQRGWPGEAHGCGQPGCPLAS